MLNEAIDLNGCDLICGSIVELSSEELKFDDYIVTSVSAPAN